VKAGLWRRENRESEAEYRMRRLREMFLRRVKRDKKYLNKCPQRDESSQCLALPGFAGLRKCGSEEHSGVSRREM
jgi:hypothetical protein